jgi:hypothetical protein
MVPEEDAPLLPIARWAYRADVSLDRSLGHSNAELQQFTSYAFGAPETVVSSHLPN